MTRRRQRARRQASRSSRRRNRPSKKNPSTGGGFYWGLVLPLAGFLGWLFWAGADIELADEAQRGSSVPSARDGRASPGPASDPSPREADSGRPGRAAASKPTASETRSSESEKAPLLPPERRRILRFQVALAREGISPGPLDGVLGEQTKKAIEAFQFRERLRATAELDHATRNRLRLDDPVWRERTVTSRDLGALTSVSSTWLGKSKQEYLGYESILEMVAEEGRATTGLIKAVNPNIRWDAIKTGASIQIPNVKDLPIDAKTDFVRIKLAKKTLQARAEDGRLLAHFPCSIGRRAQNRPVGKLYVETVVEDPNYRFDPEIFPESPEARGLDRALMIPPGPNNPVGSAWIGLDRPGYGIHGTPSPEKVGHTGSHGCFRLANWNADILLRLVEPGTPVFVDK